MKNLIILLVAINLGGNGVITIHRANYRGWEYKAFRCYEILLHNDRDIPWACFKHEDERDKELMIMKKVMKQHEPS